jgi:hypothetical protein
MSGLMPLIEQISPALARRLRRFVQGRAILSELDRLDPGERGRVLRDLALCAGDEVRLARGNLDRPDLLPRLMRRFGLRAAQLARTDADVMQDLRRCCAMCGEADRCAPLLDRGEPAGAFDFCPNADTLALLRKAMLARQPA